MRGLLFSETQQGEDQVREYSGAQVCLYFKGKTSDREIILRSRETFLSFIKNNRPL